LPAYPGCDGKEAVKVSVSLSVLGTRQIMNQRTAG